MDGVLNEPDNSQEHDFDLQDSALLNERFSQLSSQRFSGITEIATLDI